MGRCADKQHARAQVLHHAKLVVEARKRMSSRVSRQTFKVMKRLEDIHSQPETAGTFAYLGR